MKTYRKYSSILMMIVGSLCLGYELYLVVKYGHISFAWTFLAMGLVLLSVGLWELRKKTHLLFLLPKFIRYVVSLSIVLFLLLFIWVEGTIILAGSHSSRSQADTVIVLGAQLKGNTITRSLRYRLQAALSYKTQYPNATFIVSGGQGAGEDISEAKAMKDWLVAHGVKETSIIMEDISTNTQENFMYSLDKVKDDTEHISIITNSFHMKRSKMICEQTIERCSTYPAKSETDLAPVFYFREFFAYIKDWLLS